MQSDIEDDRTPGTAPRLHADLERPGKCVASGDYRRSETFAGRKMR
jgi:hypothetical protein